MTEKPENSENMVLAACESLRSIPVDTAYIFTGLSRDAYHWERFAVAHVRPGSVMFLLHAIKTTDSAELMPGLRAMSANT